MTKLAQDLSRMRRLMAVAALALFQVAPLSVGPARAATPPHVAVSATNLNGQAVSAPGAAPHTLLLLGFRHGDQDVLDGWRTGLGLRDDDASWIEVAYIGAPAMARGMIESSLRKRFAGAGARAHMAPVFGAPDPALKPLAAEPGPAVLVLDRTGAILAQAHGAFSDANARGVIAAR